LAAQVYGVVVDAQRPPPDTGGHAGMLRSGDQAGNAGVVEVYPEPVQGRDSHQQGEYGGGGLAVADDHDPATGMASEAGVRASKVGSPRLATVGQRPARPVWIVAPTTPYGVPRSTFGVGAGVGHAEICAKDNSRSEQVGDRLRRVEGTPNRAAVQSDDRAAFVTLGG
jgi:hypothetical protein